VGRLSLAVGVRKVVLLGSLWAAFAFFLALHGIARGAGDEVFRPNDISAIDGVFGVQPVAWLQRDARPVVPWLDQVCFAAYTFWFVLPLTMAIAITRKGSEHLLAFFLWIACFTLLTDVVFFLFPATPPWKLDGYSRILLERPLASYTSADNNEFAAFPSLHAGLPMLFAFFFWVYDRESRKLAWFSGGYAVTVGFAVVYLGEHWLVDVVAGWTFAGLVSWLCASSAIGSLVGRIPGDPAGKLVDLNARTLGMADWTLHRAVEAPAAPGELPRAA